MWGPAPLTARRLEVLVFGLPLESRTMRELGALKPGEWHNAEELLATLIEVVWEGHRLFFSAHAKKGKKPPAPLKVPRPTRSGEQTPPKEQSTREELLAAFSAGGVIVQYAPKDT